MKIEIDFDKLYEYNLTIEQYTLAYLIHYRKSEELCKYIKKFGKFNRQDFMKLSDEGIISPILDLEDIKLKYLLTTERCGDLFNQGIKEFEKTKEAALDVSKAPANVEAWIDSWRDLFPSGLRGGSGYLIRSSRKDCLIKMKKFVDEYPQYDINTIKEATKIYIDKQSENGYKYMKVAHYFINKKDGGSGLANECEDYVLSGSPSSSNNVNKEGYGEERL